MSAALIALKIDALAPHHATVDAAILHQSPSRDDIPNQGVKQQYLMIFIVIIDAVWPLKVILKDPIPPSFVESLIRSHITWNPGVALSHSLHFRHGR
jgi:hypothetical protein